MFVVVLYKTYVRMFIFWIIKTSVPYLSKRDIILVCGFFFVYCLNNCIHDYDTSISMFFVNNFSVFMLSVTNMPFKGFHDADPLDPSVLVLQDRHRSHLVDTKQVRIILNINYYYIS